jgi:hypothetical protein
MLPIDGGSIGASALSRRKRKPVVIVLVVMFALGAGAALGYRGFTDASLRASLKDPHPLIAQHTCYTVAEIGSPRFLNDLIALLNRSNHDDVRESAGYAIHRLVQINALSDPRGRDALAAAIERQDDDIIRAKLIVYWGRLTGDDAEPTLRRWFTGAEVWRAAGAAVALLERGDASAGNVLFEQAGCDEALRRQYCAEELARMAAPMAEMVGASLDLHIEGGNGFAREQLAALRAWWAGPRTQQLLNDHLEWHRENNPKWRLIKRMLHAREQAEGWVGLRQ